MVPFSIIFVGEFCVTIYISRIFWDYTEKLHKKPYLCTGNRTEI